MELSDKWVKENKGKRFNVKMRGREDMKNIRFFMSGTNICWMNSRQKRKGQLFPYWDMVEVTELNPKAKVSSIGNAKTLLRRLHPNVWDDLKVSFKAVADGGKVCGDFSDHFEDALKFRSMKSIFGQRVVDSLVKSFETKTPYSTSIRANSERGRDYSVSTQLDDGKFRAWFSSEYSGCLNGYYYLLLNPTTAVFYEKD